MTPRVEKRVASDQLPCLSQKLRLACLECGKQHTYDVGTILHTGEVEAEPADQRLTFCNYFRCRECGSAGLRVVADYVTMLGLALRAQVDSTYADLFEGE